MLAPDSCEVQGGRSCSTVGGSPRREDTHESSPWMISLGASYGRRTLEFTNPIVDAVYI